MYTDPQIISTNDLSKRAYIKVYIDGQRYRFYNGRIIGFNCNPNLAKTRKERDRALTSLHYNLKKMLESGWKPTEQSSRSVPQKQRLTIGDEFTTTLADMAVEDLSKLYQRTIKSVGDAFIQYLKTTGLYKVEIGKIDSAHVEDFLKLFKYSACYYMLQRRTLSGIFSRLVAKKLIKENPVHKTSRLKTKASLHQIYTKQQLHTVLDYLKTHCPNVYLCAMVTYGCFLRPHHEVRLLSRHNFNHDCTVISLDGNSNKSKRVRTVHVPAYVREVLVNRGFHLAPPNTNLFTRTESVFNEYYFHTMWKRVKRKLVKANVIGKNHSIYSFRHTAAVNLYMKTRDLHKIQMAMGHSTMMVTLIYLRSLGVVNAVTAEDIPDL